MLCDCVVEELEVVFVISDTLVPNTTVELASSDVFHIMKALIAETEPFVTLYICGYEVSTVNVTLVLLTLPDVSFA